MTFYHHPTCPERHECHGQPCPDGWTGPHDSVASDAWVRDWQARLTSAFPPAPTYPESAYKAAIQARLDAEAFRRGFTGPDETERGAMVSACSYAGYPNKYQAEAIGLGQWRSAVWDWATAAFRASLESPSPSPAPTPDDFAAFTVASTPCTAPTTQ